jgi:hypothetical protein
MLFLRGTAGFSWGVREFTTTGNNQRNVSWAAWGRYFLFHRISLIQTVPFAFGRLFQQFLVDV